MRPWMCDWGWQYRLIGWLIPLSALLLYPFVAFWMARTYWKRGLPLISLCIGAFGSIAISLVCYGIWPVDRRLSEPLIIPYLAMGGSGFVVLSCVEHIVAAIRTPDGAQKYPWP